MTELAAPHGMSLTGFIEHLRVLEAAGLTARSKEGRAVRCELAAAPLQEADGEAHEVGGTYRAVEPPAQLVFTWVWKTAPERALLVSVSPERAGTGSLMHLRHEQFHDESARSGHERGWMLARHLS